MTTKLICEGADWLTATSQSQQTADLMLDLWARLKEDQGITKAWTRDASWQGYIGERVEHGFYGVREDGACIQISGPLAAEYTKEFLLVGARPSRLDLQVTGVPGEAPGKAIERMFFDARAFKTPNGVPPSLKMFVDRTGPEGLYVGKRSSEVMLRIYDKGKESREKLYAGAVRVEAELKSTSARRYASMFCNEFDDRHFYRGVLNALCQARGMTIPFDVGDAVVVLHKTTYTTPTESKMAWLKQQVSPTIQALIDEVGWQKVASVLFPDSMDTHLGYNGQDDAILLRSRTPRLS